MIVVEANRDFVPLLGRDWMGKLWPEWKNAFKINSIKGEQRDDALIKQSIRDLKKKFHKVFDENLCEPIKNIEVDIRMEEGARPFHTSDTQ